MSEIQSPDASARKLRVLTGVKPTGVPHLGNYLGAIRPSLELADKHDSFLFIADLHALTTARDPAELREQTYGVAATWLACGLDPEQVTFYSQTDVPPTAPPPRSLACVWPPPPGTIFGAKWFPPLAAPKRQCRFDFG